MKQSIEIDEQLVCMTVWIRSAIKEEMDKYCAARRMPSETGRGTRAMFNKELIEDMWIKYPERRIVIDEKRGVKE